MTVQISIWNDQKYFFIEFYQIEIDRRYFGVSFEFRLILSRISSGDNYLSFITAIIPLIQSVRDRSVLDITFDMRLRFIAGMLVS